MSQDNSLSWSPASALSIAIQHTKRAISRRAGKAFMRRYQKVGDVQRAARDTLPGWRAKP